MAHYKRRKPRRNVRCNLCTPGRVGNSAKDGYGRAGWRRRMETVGSVDDFCDGPDELDWGDDPWDAELAGHDLAMDGRF